VEQDTAVDAVEELEDRLRRYDAERYPVQRATAAFHLGTILTASDAERAASLLEESAALFTQIGLREEAAKARNAYGASLRELGDYEAAATAFTAAAEELTEPRDRAAALYNLGLVVGDPARLEEARALFAQANARREEAAAARELGSLLLARGEAERALALLTDAADDAANPLGLALLAAGRPSDAVDAFRRAAVANPRTVRPVEFAMAKANLALAYEQCGDPARARLAARQALGVAGAAKPVREQAAALLERAGNARDDLLRVLGDEPRDRWPGIVREQAALWTADSEALNADAPTLAAALDDALAETLLGALLELPPDAFERLLDAFLHAGAREQIERAASLFHAPQELRVRETIERLCNSRAT
jgi:tetratricopeptide (TPR) repeat protein